MKDIACIMNINRACPHFEYCSSYKIKVSDNFINSPYENAYLLLGGCPSMNENPDDCKFYKEILKFNKIDANLKNLYKK